MDREWIRMKVAQELLRHSDIHHECLHWSNGEGQAGSGLPHGAADATKKRPHARFTENFPGGKDNVN